jgi:hypothetical protein
VKINRSGLAAGFLEADHGEILSGYQWPGRPGCRPKGGAVRKGFNGRPPQDTFAPGGRMGVQAKVQAKSLA